MTLREATTYLTRGALYGALLAAFALTLPWLWPHALALLLIGLALGLTVWERHTRRRDEDVAWPER